METFLDDGEVVRQKFIPSELCKSDRLDVWSKLKNELKHENRFFPTTEVDKGRLKDLLSFLQIESRQLETVFYRARIQRNTDTILTVDMGAPPKRLASQGRANPAGIPYLYIASTPQTAVSEIRPKFVDLRCPRTTVSPFMLADEVAVGLLRGDIEFLVGIGNELSIPVLPHVAAIDYIPSQYLCEFIKRQGFDGVIYQSSVGDGFNLALFYPNCVTLVATETYRVSQVSVSVELNR
ncbi:MAG: RES domain-containing protein [Sphingobacteriales bacterium]|nr:MAG: RES domain-containing protein [Sphingobacteriales bacterium]